MSDHPIIFSAPMVRALLDGRKTMTRRLAWHEPTPKVAHTGRSPKRARPLSLATTWQRVKRGDRLWVREAWRIEGAGARVSAEACRPHRASGRAIEYRADGYEPDQHRERSPIHMPRWASRLTLAVNAVKVERLRHITTADARAEGFAPLPDGGDEWHAFLDYWNKLHGDGATDANPEVVALTFTVQRANIDAEGT